MSDTTHEPKPIVPPLASIHKSLAWLAYPIVRIFAGLVLVPHGAQKLFGWFDGPGLAATAGFFENVVGVSPGLFWASLVGGVEFFGGLLIAVGLLTRVAGIMATAVLWIGFFTVHLANGFFIGNGGYEFIMLWAVVMTAITLKGGGRLSIDSAIGREF